MNDTDTATVRRIARELAVHWTDDFLRSVLSTENDILAPVARDEFYTILGERILASWVGTPEFSAMLRRLSDQEIERLLDGDPWRLSTSL